MGIPFRSPILLAIIAIVVVGAGAAAAVINILAVAGRAHPSEETAKFFPIPGVCARDGVFEGDEDGLKLYFKWFPIDELADVVILPSFLQTELKAIPETPVNINHDDS